MHPQCSSSQEYSPPSGLLLDVPDSPDSRQVAISIRTRYRQTFLLAGNICSNFTSEVIISNVTRVTDVPTHRVRPKVTSLDYWRKHDRDIDGGCHRPVKTGSRALQAHSLNLHNTEIFRFAQHDSPDSWLFIA